LIGRVERLLQIERKLTLKVRPSLPEDLDNLALAGPHWVVRVER